MLDVNREINSSSDSKRSPSDLIRQLKASGHPVVVTINGEAELVVQDARSYQKLLELAERSEELDALKRSVEDLRAGDVVPAEEMLAELRQILDEKKGR